MAQTIEEQMKLKEMPVIQKTLKLRILRPFYDEAIENEIIKKKREQREAKEKEIINENINKKERAKLLREAEKLDESFYNELKKRHPQIIIWKELSCLFVALQKEVSTVYNKIISNMYREVVFRKKPGKYKGKRKLFNEFYNVITPEYLKESAIRQGLQIKISSNFRQHELEVGNTSLPSAKTYSFPIPLWKQTKYGEGSVESGFEVKKINNDLVLTISVPNYNYYYDHKRRKGEITFCSRKSKPKKIDLVLSTLVRQRRKGWARDEGTDAEIRNVLEGKYGVRFIEINRRKRLADRSTWFAHISIEYIKSNFPCPKCGEHFWKKSKWEKDVIDRNKLKEFEESLSNSQRQNFRKNKIIEIDGKIIRYEDFEIRKGDRKLMCIKCNFEMKDKDWLENENNHRIRNKPNIGGIDVGVSRALVCAVSDSLNRYVIDGKKLIAHYNRGYARRRILQKNNYLNRAGHGKKNKFMPLTMLNEKEKRFRTKIIERWANEITRFFLKHNVGLVRMENLSSMKNKSDDFFNLKLRGKWPYYQMREKIKNKLEANGIKVDIIDSANTSKICHFCGQLNEYFTWKYRKDNNFPLFKCRRCNKVRCHDDFNSAKNLARPDIRELLEKYKNTTCN